MLCEHSPCRGREVCDELTSGSCSGVLGDATRLRIQAAGGGPGLTRFRHLSGAAQRFLYHSLLGACLGATARDRSTSAVGATPEFRTWIRTVPQRYGSPHADSAVRLVALPTEAGATLSLLRGRDSQPIARCSRDALPLGARQAATLGRLLSVRPAECFRSTPRGSAPPRTSGCRFESGGVDDPRHQVRQDSLGAFTCFDLHGAGRLPRQTSAPWGKTGGVLLLVCFQHRQSFGWRRYSSNVLCIVSANRSARLIRQPWPSSARHASSVCDKHARAMVSVRSGSRAAITLIVHLPRPCTCRRYAMVFGGFSRTHA
jgi:hypothetical protein